MSVRHKMSLNCEIFVEVFFLIFGHETNVRMKTKCTAISESPEYSSSYEREISVTFGHWLSLVSTLQSRTICLLSLRVMSPNYSVYILE